MAVQAGVPSREEVVQYFSSLSNWGRWGADDQRGTLNLITPETIRAAVGLVRQGARISCGRTIGSHPPGGDEGNPPLHFMQSSGESAPAEGFWGATDWFGLSFHGHSVTHVDAPSHIFWNGQLYNGIDARRVSTSQGAQVGSVELAQDGVVARGVLLDIPRHRGVPKLDGGEAIFSDELVACARAEGVEPGPGDVLIVRTGRDVTVQGAPPAEPPWAHPGLHVNCLPWIRARDIAMVVADVAQEVQPSGYQKLRYPLHAVSIVAMGLWLVDNAYLEDLALACAQAGTWEFLFFLAPLKLKNGTGSPVNPIAVL